MVALWGQFRDLLSLSAKAIIPIDRCRQNFVFVYCRQIFVYVDKFENLSTAEKNRQNDAANLSTQTNFVDKNLST